MSTPQTASPLTVLAAVAHPDDIEFCFAGTMLLLQQAGCSLHFWNLADGCCGSLSLPREEIARIRTEEARTSAHTAGAEYHPPLFHDLEIFYDKPSLLAVSAVVRAICPDIILTHAPHDYMEDHQNVCRLIVTAAFSRGMPNFPAANPPYDKPVRIYHAAPHGLHDGLGNPFQPDFLVDIETVIEKKSALLSCHRSQMAWLESTQSMNSFVDEMRDMARSMAKRGQNIDFAEGWKRHSHLGFCPQDFDPLPLLLSIRIQPLNP